MLNTFLTQCIQEGVRYLMRMLQVRNSVKLNDGVVLHDTATANILSEGKYVIYYRRDRLKEYTWTHNLPSYVIGCLCYIVVGRNVTASLESLLSLETRVFANKYGYWELHPRVIIGRDH